MSSKSILLIGFGLTFVFVAFSYWLGMQSHCLTTDFGEDCSTNFSRFLAASPNEKGDTLAGVAGSLAFLWIIITVLLQGKELAMQREEVSKMRETQQEQTNFLKVQSESLARSEVDEQISVMVSELIGEAKSIGFGHWSLWKKEGNESKFKKVNFVSQLDDELPDDKVLRAWAGHIELSCKRLDELISSEGFEVTQPGCPFSWLNCWDDGEQILALLPKASHAKQLWVKGTIRLPRFVEAIKHAQLSPAYWGKDDT